MTDYENCPSCNNVGWYTVHRHNGEPEQEQCEFCYTVENSIFNIISNLEQQLATIKQEATAYRISLEDLEDSLPNIKADAVSDLFEKLGTDVMIEGVAWTVVFDIDAMGYTGKLEAGNEYS